MKHPGRFIVMVAVLPVCRLAGGPAAGASLAAGQPRIVCAAPVHHFGSVDNDASITHVFPIENRGTAPLNISNVRACCGSSARMSSMTIPPGGDAALTVTVPLFGRKGRQVKTIHVMSDDPVEPRFRIQVTGTAVAALDAQPDFLNFGVLEANRSESREISVFAATGQEFSITQLVSTVPHFVAEVAETGGRVSRVAVSTAPPLPPGLTRGTIHVMTDLDHGRRVRIDVVATVAAGLVTVPREIVLVASAGAGESVDRQVVIRSRDNRDFRIIDTELPSGGMAIDVVPLSGSEYKCLVKNMTPGAGLDGKRIVLVTDRKDAERVEIPIRVVLFAPRP